MEEWDNAGAKGGENIVIKCHKINHPPVITKNRWDMTGYTIPKWVVCYSLLLFQPTCGTYIGCCFLVGGAGEKKTTRIRGCEVNFRCQFAGKSDGMPL